VGEGDPHQALITWLARDHPVTTVTPGAKGPAAIGQNLLNSKELIGADQAHGPPPPGFRPTRVPVFETSGEPVPLCGRP